MAEDKISKEQEDKFTWKAGDVEFIPPPKKEDKTDKK